MRRAVVAAVAALALSCASARAPGALVPPTVDQDPALPRRTLTVAGHARAVHLRTFGDPANPPVLFLHGSLSDHRSFLPFRALADRYFVVLWDQRGNGLSERIGADEYGWDAVVEEIDAVKALFAPDRKVALVGHSFGAMYATLYLARRPEAVTGAVLLEPGGLTGRIFGDTLHEILQVELLGPGLAEALWQSEVLSPSDHEALDLKALRLLLDGRTMRYHCDPAHPVPIPVWRPGAHVEWLRGVHMGAAGFVGARFDFDFAAGLERFGGPVLLLGGECSALGHEYQVKHHLPLFRNATAARVARAGHRLHVEQPEEVLRLVRAGLDAARAASGEPATSSLVPRPRAVP